MSNSQRSADAPVRRDRGQRRKDESASFKLRMRDFQFARAPLAAAPKGDVEVEHAWTPPAAAASAEFALETLNSSQHFWWVKRALDQRHGIGEIASGGPSLRWVEDDRRGVEESEILIEPGDRRFDHLWWAAEVAVRAIGPNGDGVKVRHWRRA